MKTITFNTAKELKQATRTGWNYTPQFNVSSIASINGYELTKLGLDITNTNVTTYSPSKGTIHFSAPFILTLKN